MDGMLWHVKWPPSMEWKIAKLNWTLWCMWLEYVGICSDLPELKPHWNRQSISVCTAFTQTVLGFWADSRYTVPNCQPG